MSAVRLTAKIVKDIDLGVFDRMKKRFAGADLVKIGYPAGTKGLDGTPLPMVAAVHEFGLPEKGIPERSFLRSSVRENKQKYIKLNGINLLRVLRGQITMNHALGLLGDIAAGDARKKIKSGPFAPIEPQTIARRTGKSTKPLIDTGQLLQSLTYVVGAE